MYLFDAPVKLSLAKIATRGKSSMGWVYGCKLHVVMNQLGEIVRSTLSNGHIADIKMVEHLVESLEAKLMLEKKEAYASFEKRYTHAFKDELIAKLQAIQNDEKLCLPKSEEKLYKYIKEILTKRLKKIAKTSKKLSLEAPNERFHKLRLHYKKLRYNADAIKLSQFSKSFKGIQNAFGRVQDKNTQIERLKRYQTPENECLEHIVTALEHELLADKQACIEVSNKESIVKIEKKLKKLFTCKSR